MQNLESKLTDEKMMVDIEKGKVKDLSHKLQDTNKKRQQAEERFSRIKSVHVTKLAKTRETVLGIVEAL